MRVGLIVGRCGSGRGGLKFVVKRSEDGVVVEVAR